MNPAIQLVRERFMFSCFCQEMEDGLVKFGLLDRETATAFIEQAITYATFTTVHAPICEIIAENERACNEVQAEADVVALFERVMR